MRGEKLDATRSGRLISPSAERNKAPIAEILDGILPDRGTVLEVSSGTGQHIVHFARRIPRLIWQPTERDPDCMPSIRAWCEHEGLPNVREPVLLDVCQERWPITSAEAVICLNMIHIAPWSATEGLLRGAGRLLQPGRLLFLYGPFRRDGTPTAASNAEFDRQLRARNSDWGVRDLEDVTRQAVAEELALDDVRPLPANNFGVWFRRR